ncbi:hypothetical protein [Ruegeria discodermiae]|uniref:hypothetical protein n=1 Tax=Ruegeria discodermiae TaxID=3064389 RepID=UPI0035321664
MTAISPLFAEAPSTTEFKKLHKRIARRARKATEQYSMGGGRRHKHLILLEIEARVARTGTTGLRVGAI